MDYVLITLDNKIDDTISLLVPADTDIALIIENRKILFELQSATAQAMKDLFNTDKEKLVKDLVKRVEPLKKAGIIGFPLDIHDASLYAHDRKLTVLDSILIDI